MSRFPTLPGTCLSPAPPRGRPARRAPHRPPGASPGTPLALPGTLSGTLPTPLVGVGRGGSEKIGAARQGGRARGETKERKNKRKEKRKGEKGKRGRVDGKRARCRKRTSRALPGSTLPKDAKRFFQPHLPSRDPPRPKGRAEPLPSSR